MSMTKRTAIIVGSGSDIARELSNRLRSDGWDIVGCSHRDNVPLVEWDLLLLTQGVLDPIGTFFEIDEQAWIDGVIGNGLNVLSHLRAAWPLHKPMANVVFFGGPNMLNPSGTYSAYRCGKALLEALVPTLNAEYTCARFFIFHPGLVNTKIHEQTLAAGSRAWNFNRISKIRAGIGASVSHCEVYERLTGLIG